MSLSLAVSFIPAPISCCQEGEVKWLASHLLEAMGGSQEGDRGRSDRLTCLLTSFKMRKCYMSLVAVNIPQFLHLIDYTCFKAFNKDSVLNR